LYKETRYINNDGVQINRNVEHFTEAMTEEGYRFPSHKLGARLFDEISFPVGMSDNDIGKMTRLSKLMVGKTNILGYRKNREIISYSAAELCDIIGLSTKRGMAFIRNMIKFRVIKRINDFYYVNPAYFMSTGQRLSLELFIHFQDELKSILPEWVITDFVMQAQVKKHKK
jgi:hypothetical protein